MSSIDDLVERYVALWNDPDAERRGRTIRELWTPDGGQLLQPPQDMQAVALAIGFPLRALEVRGYTDLKIRVAHAYEQFVAPGTYEFRRRDAPCRVADVVKFRWEMVERATTQIAAVGLEILVLDRDQRIVHDYQFIEA